LRTAVVGPYHQKVLAGWLDRGRDVETESGKGSGMLAEIVSVQPNIGNDADPVELKKVTSHGG
jgi:hypothetical protein